MSEWRLWKGLAVLTAALYAGLAWIWFAQLVPEAGGLTPFDGRLLGYSYEDAQAFLVALSDQGRTVYLNDVRLLDTVFPVALGVLLAWPLWRLPGGSWRFLAVWPIGYVIADLWENARVAGILRADVTSSPDVIAFASALTQTKYALLIVSMIALLLVYVRTRKA